MGSTQEIFTLNVRAARLSRANLEEADLSRAKATGVDFRQANLHGAKLHFTQLDNANLSGANLTDADLSHANLREAKLKGTIFDGANISGANLSNAEGLNLATLQGTFGDPKTVLPKGLSAPDHWPRQALKTEKFLKEWRKWQADPEGYTPPDPPDGAG